MGISKVFIMEPKIQNDASIVKSASDKDEIIKNAEENIKILKDDDEVESSKNSEIILKDSDSINETKIQLSFSVDRLLNNIESVGSKERLSFNTDFEKCCEQQQNFSCCSHPSCLLSSTTERIFTKPYQISSLISSEAVSKLQHGTTVPSSTIPFSDYASKCIVRPLPIRALSGNNCDNAPHCLPFPTMATTTLFRLHQQQQKPIFPHPHSLPFTQQTTTATNLAISPLMVTPLTCNLKSLQLNAHATPTQLQQHQQQQHFRQSAMSPISHFTKTKLSASPTISTSHYHPTLHQLHQHQQQQQLQHQPILTHLQLGNSSSTTTATTHNININNSNNNGCNHNNGSNNNNNNNNNNNHSNNGKRKRSWSRAVFSNLQRKGLEIQFQQQKYITKPDRRKLAARLNLTDAQVKVWFQNRRMKWRHTRENLKSGQEKQAATVESQGNAHQQQMQSSGDMQLEMGYSSDGSDCSMVIDDNEDDGEIDVVE